MAKKNSEIGLGGVILAGIILIAFFGSDSETKAPPSPKPKVPQSHSESEYKPKENLVGKAPEGTQKPSDKPKLVTGTEPTRESEVLEITLIAAEDWEPTAKAAKALIPTNTRTWTSTDGKTVFGSVTAYDPVKESVDFRNSEGKEFSGVPLAYYSESDRDYITNSAVGILTGRVVGVRDGDSITLLVAGNSQYRIRLEAIDAPEIGQEFGNKSKLGLSDLVYDKDVEVKVTGNDKYGRVLGWVYQAESNVNHLMVVRGLAWHFVEYSKDPALAQAEKFAKQTKSGLWSGFNPMAPWDYRDLSNVAKVDPPTSPPKSANSPTPATPFVETTPKPVAATYWLNTSSSVRHNRGCRWYGNTKGGRYCTGSEGRACGICGG